MVSKSQQWWTNEHPGCSLKYFQSMSVFESFSKCVVPRVSESGLTRTAFWIVDNCDIYEWFDKSIQEGEKFGHDRNSETWFYEHWFLEGKINVVVKTWLCRPAEWGLIIKYYPDKELHAVWNVGNGEQILEEFTKTDNSREGARSGLRNTPNGPEDFTEKFWEEGAKSRSEGSWVRGNTRGGFSKETENTRNFTKSWTARPLGFENKEINEEGGETTGTSEGKQGPRTWRGSWTESPGRKTEEKEFEEGASKWGSVREEGAEGTWELQWTGQKPEFGAVVGDLQGDLARVHPQLLQLYRKQKELAVSSQETLSDLAGLVPGLRGGLEGLEKELEEFKDPGREDIAGIVTKTQGLLTFNCKQEQLKKRAGQLLGTQVVSLEDLKKLACASEETTKSLLGLAALDRKDSLAQQCEDLAKNSPSIEETQDMLFILGQYSQLTKDLVSALGGQDVLRSIRNSLPGLLAALNSSDQTLEQIITQFTPNEECSRLVRDPQKTKLLGLRKSFEQHERFDCVLDRTTALMQDLEQYKRELTGDQLLRALNALNSRTETTAQSLATALGEPTALAALHPAESTVALAIAQAERLCKLSDIFTRKLLGTPCEPDPEFQSLIDSIKSRRPGSSLSFDCNELLRKFWFDGKMDQDHTKLALSTLAAENAEAQEFLDEALSSVTGQVPEDPLEASQLLKETLGHFMHARIKESELLCRLLKDPGTEGSSLSLSPKATLSPKRSPKLRSKTGSPVKPVDLSAHARDCLEHSLDTFTELILGLTGPSELTQELLEKYNNLKEQTATALEAQGGKATAEDLFSLLRDLESEKRAVLQRSETCSGLAAKLDNLLGLVCKSLNLSLPAEVENLRGCDPAHSLAENSKQATRLLNVLFSFFAEHEPVAQEESAEPVRMVGAFVRFNPISAYSVLRSSLEKELANIEFLAQLVGSEEDLAGASALPQTVAQVLPEEYPANNQQAVKALDGYFSSSGLVREEMNGLMTGLLNKVLDLLNDPEPSEADFNVAQEAIENNQLIMKKLCNFTKTPVDPEAQALTEDIPARASEILPYSWQLTKRQSQINLQLIGELTEPASPQELRALQQALDKKKSAAPLRALRPLQPFLKGPHTGDFIELVVKLHRTTELLSKDTSSLTALEENYSKLHCLQGAEVISLAKNYANTVLSLLQSVPEDCAAAVDSVRSTRKDSAPFTVVSWRDIFKAKGFDIDLHSLSELFAQEQASATAALSTLSRLLGDTEAKRQCNHLLVKSTEILQQENPERQLENYIHLRRDQSKLVKTLAEALECILERMQDLENERSNATRLLLNEVSLAVPEGETAVHTELAALGAKANEYDEASKDSVVEIVVRVLGRVYLDKQLAKLKETARPSENEELKLLGNLRDVEANMAKHLQDSLSTLHALCREFSSEEDSKQTEYLAEAAGGSQTVNEAVGSLLLSLDNGNKLEQKKREFLENSDLKARLVLASSLVLDQGTTEAEETDAVFSGLFKLAGTNQDKNTVKALNIQRTLLDEAPASLCAQVALLQSNLTRLLPTKTLQTQLKAKILKEIGGLREGADEIELQTEGLLDKLVRDIENSTHSEDKLAKEQLDKLKKQVENLHGEAPTNLGESILKINLRLELWDRLDRLRRDLKDKTNKELFNLRDNLHNAQGDLQDQHAAGEDQKQRLESQIELLQSAAAQKAALIAELSEESSNKEKALGQLSSSLAEHAAQGARVQEDMNRLQTELEKTCSELTASAKDNKDNQQLASDLQKEMDNYKALAEENFKGDKQLLENLNQEIGTLKQSLTASQRGNDALQNTLAHSRKDAQDSRELLESSIQGLELAKKELDSANAQLHAENSQLRDQLKTASETPLEELATLEQIIDDKELAYQELDEALEDAKKYQPLYSLLKEENEALATTQHRLEIEKSDLARKSSDLTLELDALKYKTRDSGKFQAELENSEIENQKLKYKIESLEQYSGESSEALRQLIDQTNEETAEKSRGIQDLSRELAELKQDHTAFTDYHNKCTNRNFLIRFCAAYRRQQEDKFRQWKNITAAGPPPVTTFDIEKLTNPRYSALLTAAQEEPGELGQAELQRASDILAQDNLQLIENNVVISSFRQVASNNERPLSYINIFKFLEELMDLKFKSDERDIKDHREPRTMTEFLLEHLQRSFGIQKLAAKFLGQLIPTLQKLYDEGHPYAILYARLLHMMHPDPVPYNMAVFLVRIRMEFHNLVDKFDRFKLSFGRKDTKLKGKSHGRTAYEAAGTGGLALISDVIDLVYGIFADDKDCGTYALSLLKPVEVSEEQYSMYRICHKIASHGKTPEGIFHTLDRDGGGTVSYEELLRGLKGDLDVWITTGAVKQLFGHMTHDTEDITKEAFLQKISLKALMEWNKDDNFVISKCDFLTALINTFKYRQTKDIVRLNARFTDIKNFSREEFIGMTLNLDPELDEKWLLSIYNSAYEAQETPAEIEKDTAIKLILKLGIGGYGLGVFRIKELLSIMSMKKVVAKIEIEEAKTEEQKIVASSHKRKVVKRTISRK